MDIQINKKTARWKFPLLVGAGVTGFALIGSLLASPNADYTIERSQVVLGTVKRGDLQVSVDGYGVLRSNRQQLITAQSAATVAEILLRPGAAVTADSVILRLQDTELTPQLETAAMAVTEQQAAVRRVKLANQREMLAEQAILAELSATRDGQKLRRIATEDLARRGVIPAIEYQTAQLQEQQLSERINLQQTRLFQLQEMANEDLNIATEQLNQAKSRLQRLELRQTQLTVRAGISGVLQRLPVELGQGVIAGQELAQVGSSQDLQALVRISQSKIEQLAVGQRARINTRRETAEATVSRITPQVQDGTIEVELSFSQGVPASARPELNIDAQIFTADLTNTLYLERPVNVQSHTSTRLFKYNSNKQQLDSTVLTVGEDAGRFLQLTQGAAEGDTFVISDMAAFADASQIAVQN